jgi:hypothetical protein
VTRLLVPLTVVLALGVGAQETKSAKTPEAVVEHLLGPSPTLRRQAVAWARDHLDEVAALLARALREKPASSMPFDAIRSLGELKDDRVAEALLAVASRPDFPWRPHAIEALADQAFPNAAGLFVRSAASPVARSRAAACRGIRALGIREMDGPLSKALGDEEAAVRLEAARTLLAFGNASGVATVVRDLSLDRRFTDADPGSVARDAASGFLTSAFPVAPEVLPKGVATQADLVRVWTAIRPALGEAPGLPDSVTVHEPDAPASLVYALEARSCLEGDFFARFDDAGNVVLGRDLLRRYEVDPKVVAPIATALKAMDTGPRRRRIAGPITCDFERLGVLEDGGWRTLVLGTGKRDPALDAMEDAVLDLLRQIRGPGAADAHRRRVAPFRVPEAAPSRPAESAPAGSGSALRQPERRGTR